MGHKNFPAIKMKFSLKFSFDIFDICAQNINYGYTLEPPRRGGSNEYPQSMFWIIIKKNNRYIPVNPSFIKVGYGEWLYISWTCYTDGLHQENMSEK